MTGVSLQDRLPPRPFTVIAGFLGAGKTTLVNRILGQATGTRFAVLVNDFGAINVDATLIAEHDGQTLSLTNGCICCSMADGFIQTMLQLMAEPEKFDHVVVEASGVAEPSKIMDFARLDPQLDPDAIVTLADAETLTERLNDPRVSAIVAAQIRQADLILLTKTDHGDPAEARAHLARLNPQVPATATEFGNVPLEVVLGTGHWKPKPEADLPGHAPRFHTRMYISDRPLDPAKFADWQAALPDLVLRGKGIALLDGDRTVLWQRIGRRNTLVDWPGPERRTELVLIGTEPIAVPELP